MIISKQVISSSIRFTQFIFLLWLNLILCIIYKFCDIYTQKNIKILWFSFFFLHQERLFNELKTDSNTEMKVSFNLLTGFVMLMLESPTWPKFNITFSWLESLIVIQDHLVFGFFFCFLLFYLSILIINQYKKHFFAIAVFLQFRGNCKRSTLTEHNPNQKRKIKIPFF